MLKQHNRFFLSCQIALDLSLVTGSWFAARHFLENNFFNNNSPDVSFRIGEEGFIFGSQIYQNQLNLSLFEQPFLIALAGLLYCFFRAGLYTSFRGSILFSDLRSITKGLLYFALPAWCLTTLKPEWNVPWQFALSFLGISLTILGICRAFERIFLQHMRARGFNQRHILVVGTGRHAQGLVQKINHCRWMGFKIVGFIDDQPEIQKKKICGFNVLGTLNDLENIVKKNKIDQVYCALPFDQMDKTMAVSKILSKTTTDFRVVPDLVSLTTLNTSLFEIDGLPVLGIRESPLQGFGTVQKRIFDVAFSILALIFFSPLMLLIAILIKLSSKGPVLYRQERLGYDGKKFNILKFRSMACNAESKSGPVFACKNDQRTTALGAFLRRTSLDELPQFFNVLSGSMSVVGPRPERPEFINDFTEEIPRYMLRNKTKAGMTGWAQVNGWRGDTSLRKRVQYDLYYLENWSIWFDLRIVFDTIIRGFVNKNAY